MYPRDVFNNAECKLYAGDHSTELTINVRLTVMQIFIVYARIHDLIASVQIIIQFYTSLARERLQFEIRETVQIAHLQT